MMTLDDAITMAIDTIRHQLSSGEWGHAEAREYARCVLARHGEGWTSEPELIVVAAMMAGVDR
jgi:hypothetical protein